MEILPVAGVTHAERLDALLEALGHRKMTNVLVEGGACLLRTLFEMGAVDEVRVFTAQKDAGGDAPAAPSLEGIHLANVMMKDLDGDEYMAARVAK